MEVLVSLKLLLEFYLASPLWLSATKSSTASLLFPRSSHLQGTMSKLNGKQQCRHTFNANHLSKHEQPKFKLGEITSMTTTLFSDSQQISCFVFFARFVTILECFSSVFNRQLGDIENKFFLEYRLHVDHCACHLIAQPRCTCRGHCAAVDVSQRMLNAGSKC